MANPQRENGYTAIANEIMDALCRMHPGGSEGQVLWAILRKTYGWGKRSDRISISQLSEITGLARRTVIYALQNLEAKKMVVVTRSRIDARNDVNVIEFQKDHELWVVQEIDGSARKGKSYKATIEKQKDLYKSRVVQEIDGSARNSERVVQEIENDAPFLAPTKETITKTNNTKDRGPRTSARKPPQSDTEWMESLKNNPAYNGLDVNAVYHKMAAWCQVNNKSPSRKRFVNWLNREEKPMSVGGGNGNGAGRQYGGQRYGRPRDTTQQAAAELPPELQSDIDALNARYASGRRRDTPP